MNVGEQSTCDLVCLSVVSIFYCFHALIHEFALGTKRTDLAFKLNSIVDRNANYLYQVQLSKLRLTTRIDFLEFHLRSYLEVAHHVESSVVSVQAERL